MEWIKGALQLSWSPGLGTLHALASGLVGMKYTTGPDTQGFYYKADMGDGTLHEFGVLDIPRSPSGVEESCRTLAAGMPQSGPSE